MYNRQQATVDESVKEELLRLPADEVIRLLFPSHPVRRRGAMRSPFRDDRSPSFSCFRSGEGHGMWKDHSTGETGDNIALVRRAYPTLSYPDAVDALSRLALGRTALTDGDARGQAVLPARAVRVLTEREEEGALKVVRDIPAVSPGTPSELVRYWRGRGISDATMTALGCRCVTYVNTNMAGRTLTDRESGLPLLDGEGHALTDDGMRTGIGLRNDIGGYSLRGADTPEGRRGFKGCTSSAVTTLTQGRRPLQAWPSLDGQGDNIVSYVRYDRMEGSLYINDDQCFRGMPPDSLPLACPFLYSYMGMTLTGRDAQRVAAALAMLTAPCAETVTVVEGMFDGLSVAELWRRGGRRKGDIVILNSTVNARWSVPFLCRHRTVTLMLDRDARSGTGQRAAEELRERIAELSSLAGVQTPDIIDGTRIFSGYKDINEMLTAGANDGKTRILQQLRKLK